MQYERFSHDMGVVVIDKYIANYNTTYMYKQTAKMDAYCVQGVKATCIVMPNIEWCVIPMAVPAVVVTVITTVLVRSPLLTSIRFATSSTPSVTV